ncbi:3771_t:CDS:2, partial [Cetraspora pellucida]
TSGTWIWSPRSIIQLNVNKKKGFIRFNTVKKDNSEWTEWQQYLIDDSGKLSKLTSNNISIINPGDIKSNTFMITTIPTITGDYAILYVNSSSLITRGGLYITTITYNETGSSDQVLLYQITNSNVTFLGLYCDTAPTGIGYICIVEMSYNANLNSSYIKVDFLTSKSVLSINLLSNIDAIDSTFVSEGLGMQAMTFGGYIFYAINKTTVNYTYYIWPYNDNNNALKPLGPFSTTKYAINAIYNNINQNNLNAANSIMNNNTFILAASPNLTSWSLYMIRLPKILNDSGYGNLQIYQIDPSPNSPVDSNTNSLRIIFKRPVISSIGYITIYKSSDTTMRQKIKATRVDLVKIANDVVDITIIGSTFNQYNEVYYVQMDPNFVRDAIFYEPLTGIDEKIVTYKSTEAAVCLARLTADATTRFGYLSETNKTKYFNDLLQEISVKLPVRRELLTIEGTYQYITINSISNLQFAIRVNQTVQTLDNYNTVTGLVLDLNNMIKHKEITVFSNGLTNDLDETYGFRPEDNIFGVHKKEIIIYFTIAAVNIVLYILSRLNKLELGDLKEKINIATSGLFSASYPSLASIFAFSDTNNYEIYGLASGTILLINSGTIEKIFEDATKNLVESKAMFDVFAKDIPQLVITEGGEKNEGNNNNEEGDEKNEGDNNNEEGDEKNEGNINNEQNDQ